MFFRVFLFASFAQAGVRTGVGGHTFLGAVLMGDLLSGLSISFERSNRDDAAVSNADMSGMGRLRLAAVDSEATEPVDFLPRALELLVEDATELEALAIA